MSWYTINLTPRTLAALRLDLRFPFSASGCFRLFLLWCLKEKFKSSIKQPLQKRAVLTFAKSCCDYNCITTVWLCEATCWDRLNKSKCLFFSYNQIHMADCRHNIIDFTLAADIRAAVQKSLLFFQQKSDTAHVNHFLLAYSLYYKSLCVIICNCISILKDL